MATKFSQITSGGNFVGSTDQILAVRGGSSDVLVTFPSTANTINALDYGAKFDGKMLIDCSWSSSTATISSASYTFTAADVGKCICLKDDKSVLRTTTYRRVGTISSVSGGGATVSGGNMPNTISGTGYCFFGTDDTAAIQAAIAAANPDDYANTGSWQYKSYGTVVLPVGMSFITQEIIIRPCVRIQGQGWRSTWLKWASTTGMGGVGYYGMFNGPNANTGGQRCYYDCHFENFRMDMTAATIAGQTYHAKCLEAIYMVRPVFKGLFLEGSPATSIGIDYVSGAMIYDNYFLNPGRLWSNGMGGSSALDFQTNSSENYTSENPLIGKPLHNIISRNVIVDAAVSGVRCTDNGTTNTGARTIISNNLILNNMANGKGIEDNGNLGAIIIGNTCAHYEPTAQTSEGPYGTEGQWIWCGIQSSGGKDGVIEGNTITGQWYDGIRLSRFEKSGASITPENYRVMGNVIDGAYRSGIRIVINSTYSMKNVGITGNTVCLNGASGIAVSNAGTGGNVTNLHIAGNQIYDNGATTATDTEKAGILIEDATAGLVIGQNYIYDSGPATQKYGILVNNVAVSDALIEGNHISGNTTSAISLVGTGSIAGEVVGNKGYHLGAASVSPGASPWTYTAGVTPEVVYVNGGTVSGITKNSQTVTSPVYLNPNESVVVTYSVAPAIVADKK